MIENRKRRLSVTTQGNVSYEQVTNYDEWSRPSLMRTRPAGASNGDALEWTCAYSYDVAGRLDRITDSQVSENPFIYSYHPNANLITSMTHPNGMVVNREWEERGHLTNITTTDSGDEALRSFDYRINTLGQRETIEREV